MYVRTRKLFLNLTKSLVEANRHRHSDGNVNDEWCDLQGWSLIDDPFKFSGRLNEILSNSLDNHEVYRAQKVDALFYRP